MNKKLAPITFKFTMDGKNVVKTFTADTIKVGSLHTAQLHVPHQSVSRMHCYIQRYDDEFYVSDLGSAGGTYVDGQRVNRAKLQHGDVLKLGQVELVVVIGEEDRLEDDVPEDLRDPLVEPVDVDSNSLPAEGVLVKLAGFAKGVANELTQSHVYYCEQCLHLHGKVIEMEQKCPECQGRWRLNRGQARHTVSMKLQHYWKLAKRLGIR